MSLPIITKSVTVDELDKDFILPVSDLIERSLKKRGVKLTNDEYDHLADTVEDMVLKMFPNAGFENYKEI